MIFRLTSKKPVLLAGNGVRAAGAETLLYKFAEKTAIPVLTTMNAVDLIQDSMKIGFIGTYGNRVANIILNNCDLLISIGARLGLRQVGHISKNFAPNAALVRVDVDQYELSRDVKIDEEKYLMDAKIFLENLLAENVPRYSQWNEKCFRVKKILDKFDKTAGNWLVEKISALLPANAVVAGKTGRIFINGGYGSMGCALPISIGASIAGNKCVVFCITGDGGLQMNIQELETVVRENLPIKILVINNTCLGKISEIQMKSYDARFSQTTTKSGYSVPNFEQIAIAYGIKAATLPSGEFLKNYESWLLDEYPCLINVFIPEDTELIPKIQWATGEILPSLESHVEAQVNEILNL